MEIKGVKVDAISKLVKDIVMIVLVGVAILKIIEIDIALTFSELSATDLVALLLAVFSVGLSAAFYFAATGSSERFYHNMHTFTKDTSVILGELKEQVKSVDKGLEKVDKGLEKYVSNTAEPNNEKLKIKEQAVVEAREDIHQFMSKVFDKLAVDQVEKDKLKAELAFKEQQLSEHEDEFSAIKVDLLEEKLNKVRGYLFRRLNRLETKHDSFEELLERIKPKAFSPFERDLISLGWFENDEFTSKGFEAINQIYKDVGGS